MSNNYVFYSVLFNCSRIRISFGASCVFITVSSQHSFLFFLASYRQHTRILKQQKVSNQSIFPTQFCLAVADKLLLLRFLFLVFASSQSKSVLVTIVAVFSGLCLRPQFDCTRESVSLTSCLAAWWRPHLWPTYSVVWSSWPHGQVGEGTSLLAFRYMWSFKLLFAASRGQLAAVWTAGGDHPSVFLAVRAPWWCFSWTSKQSKLYYDAAFAVV